jgi:fructose-specific component phosphotransferase system IIB-like protein
MYDISALGQAINFTFGASSSPDGQMSVRASLLGESMLSVKFEMIVNIFQGAARKDAMKLHDNTAESEIIQFVKRISADYKDITGKNIKFSKVNEQVNLEDISLNSYSPKRTSKYIKTVLFEIK